MPMKFEENQRQLDRLNRLYKVLRETEREAVKNLISSELGSNFVSFMKAWSESDWIVRDEFAGKTVTG